MVGTPAGDPVEARALGNVYGAAATRPVLIGSVKTNIGTYLLEIYS
jgi:acyl transferase domain-containing protein